MKQPEAGFLLVPIINSNSNSPSLSSLTDVSYSSSGENLSRYPGN